MNLKNIIFDIILSILISGFIGTYYIDLFRKNNINRKGLCTYIMLFTFSMTVFKLFNPCNIELIIGGYLIMLIELLILYDNKSILYLFSTVLFLIVSVIDLLLFMIISNIHSIENYSTYINDRKSLIFSISIFLLVHIIVRPIINKKKFFVKKILLHKDNNMPICILLSIIMILSILTRICVYKHVLNYIKLTYIIISLILMIYTIIIKLKESYKILVLEEKNIILESQYYMQIKHYEKYKESYKKYKEFKHDTKNHLIAINILINRNDFERAKEYINEIEDNLKKINIINYTNNLVLDSVLYNFNEICNIKSIELLVKANIKKNNMEILDFTEFLIKVLYSCISLIEGEYYDRKIICEVKSKGEKVFLYIKLDAFTNENDELEYTIIKQIIQKGKNLNAIMEVKKENHILELKCLL